MFIMISKNWQYVSYNLEIANPRDPLIRNPLIRDPLNTDAPEWTFKYIAHSHHNYNNNNFQQLHYNHIKFFDVVYSFASIGNYECKQVDILISKNQVLQILNHL